MAKVRDKGKEIENQAIVTEAQGNAREHWVAKIQSKCERARTRQEARASRSPKEQIALLDQRLGKDQGAARERARLLAAT